MGKGGERPPKMAASEHTWSEVSRARDVSLHRRTPPLYATPPPKLIVQVTKHRSPNDAWLVCNNKVYDVSGWHEHPGGDVIFTAAGDDATDVFAIFHGPGTTKHLDRFCIGTLDAESRKTYSTLEPKSEGQVQFERGYRALRAKLKAMGLFKSSALYYAYKQITTLALAVATAAIVATFTGRTWTDFGARTASAMLLGIFFQQCGWLCHEILHHQVFSTRAVGHWVGYFWGNVAQGFSTSWWMNKHNTHHAVPNVHATGADAQNGDPDIDTMPYLAWSRPMLKQATSAFATFMVSNQHFAYFPLLAFARISWLQQSIAYVLNLDETAGRQVKGAPGELKPVPHEKLELFLLGVHYAWYFRIAAMHPTFLHGLWFVLVSNVTCGLALAIVFSLGHNGMTVYNADARPDFWKLQVTTTRNITQDRFGFIHWFCGGLDYQVEHHLFPTAPRHNLHKICKLTKEFCAAHGVKYHETGIIEGTREVLTHLKDIATEFVHEFPAM